jgi:hypothetical protein
MELASLAQKGRIRRESLPPEEGTEERSAMTARMMTEKDNIVSSAERLVYNVLEGGLNSEFRVYQGVRVHARSSQGIDREIDFLIVHPSHGLLIIEVKGGRIFIDKDGKWWSVSRDDLEHEIVSPVEQVWNERHELQHYLRGHPETHSVLPNRCFHRAIWFPSIVWDRCIQFPQLDAACILDKISLHDTESAVIRAYRGYRMKHSFSIDDLEAIHHALRPWTNPYFGLKQRIDREEEAFGALTHEQAKHLPDIIEEPRVIVEGGAGIGKTVLAFELAWKRAELGDRVLFLCFTQYQARQQQEQLATRNDSPRTLDVYDVYSLAQQMARESGQEFRVSASAVSSGDGQKKLQQIMNRAIAAIRRERGSEAYRFDVIIVDEGQDFEPCLWQPIWVMSTQWKEAKCWVFRSHEQRFDFPDEWKSPFDPRENVRHIQLEHNCRNSFGIYRLMRSLLAANVQLAGDDEEDESVEFSPIPADHHNIDDHLMSSIQGLLDNGISAESIMIISCRAKSSRYEERVSRLGNWNSDRFPAIKIRSISPKSLTKSGYANFSTVRSAKGLEFDIVILVELDGLEHENRKRRNKLLYTAVSRAKHHLIVLGSREEVAKYASLE